MKTSNTRPSWKVDLKWIGGLLAGLLLAVTFILFGLERITAPSVAIESMTTASALLFSPRGLDDPQDIEDLKSLIAESESGVVRPIEGLDIEVRATDLEGKTARQAKLDLFRQVVEPVYYGTQSELTSIDQLGALAFFSDRVHGRLVTWTIVAAVLSLIPLALMIWMSRRFGRLVSPGVLLVTLTLLPVALLLAAKASFRESDLPEDGLQESSQLIGYIGGYVGPRLVRAFSFPYRWALFIGLALLAAGLIGRVVYGIAHKKEEPRR